MKVERVVVPLPLNRYEILIGSSIVPLVADFIKKKLGGRDGLIITDTAVAGCHGESFKRELAKAGLSYPVIAVPPGDKSKSLEMASFLYDSFFEHKLDRKSPILAFGGGVVGDLAGFAAATFMRGLPYVQVPTTLLADVDSSVGGKVAVNHPAGKNMIGAFYQPKAVFVDIEYLKTLEVGELNAGMAEVVKYGMIRDERFFEFLEESWKDILNLEPEPLLHVIRRSVEIKAEVVSKDEKEQGLRAILNFGHTVGHAIEASMGYSRLRHGEAVSIGMVAAAVMACNRDMFPEEDVSRLKELLTFLSLPTFSAEVSADAIEEFMKRDKKVIAGRLRFVLPERVGSVRIVDDVTMDEVLRALSECENV